MSIDPTLIPTLVCSYGGKYDTAYITLEEAQAIAGSKFDADTWTNLQEPQQIAAIISATRDIDNALSWVGWKYFYNQNLEFPRKTTEDLYAAEPDSTYYEQLTNSQDQLEMKKAVKLACFEQAFWIAKMSDDDVHSENQRRGISSYSESFGPISESYSYKEGTMMSRLCPTTLNLLRKYRAQPKLVRG
jgi:hypothetical protein